MAAAHPIYVTRIDARANTVTLGEEADLMADALIADEWTWTAPAGELEAALERAGDAGLPVSARIRYHQQGQAARLKRASDAERAGCAGEAFRIDFADAQRAIAPGQAVVVYDGDTVLGGGRIVRAV